MAVPINIPTGRVVGQFVMGVVDGDGPDAKPQFVPARGAIDFTSSPPYLPANTGTAEPVTVLKTTTTAVLDSEGFICTPSAMNPELPARRGIPLMATDAKGSSVEGWTWTVSARFVDENGAGLAVTIPEFNFALPSNSVIDLTSVVKVPASPGIGEDQSKSLAAAAQASALSAAADAKQARADSILALTETTKIPAEVARAVAADTTVARAAAEAVTEQIAGRKLVETTDPRLPAVGDEQSFRVQNQDGGIPFRVEGDSTWVGNTELIPDDDHWRFLSLNKRILLDIDPVSGQVYAPNLRVDSIISPAGSGVGGAVSRVVLILGAGQSNMRGKAQPYGPGLDYADHRIQMWHWGTKQLTTATVPLSGPTTTSTDGFGPLNEIAKQTLKSEPEGTAVVILQSAVGNTTLLGESSAGTWPYDYTGNVPKLYEQMITEIPKTLAAIQAQYGITPEIRFYWHQGEADAGSTDTYIRRFTELVTDLRTRLNLPEMPVVLGGMVPEYIAANPNRASIRAAHIQLPATLARSAYVDGIPNSGGSSSITDLVHYHREASEALGAAMYAATRRAVVNRPKSVPLPVANVKAVLAGGKLTASWEQPLCAVTGYNAEYSVDGGSTWTLITRPLALEPSAQVAVSAATAQVRVATINALGVSVPSTPVIATIGA